MHVEDFLAEVRQIAEECPTYRTGGTGKDGTCDCIGMVMGAMERAAQQKFPLHSSNYFARHEMLTLDAVQAADLEPGMLVYKARADNGSLHERYREGGEYCNSDPLDYYHAGVVVTVQPMRIVHCTSTAGINGIAWDDSVKGWTHAGWPKRVSREKPEQECAEMAEVYTKDGNPLHLRSTPDTRKPYIAKIPNGDWVQVLAEAEGWAKVCWQGKTGYCMSQYLRMEEPQATAGTVTITMERQAARQLLKALEQALE